LLHCGTMDKTLIRYHNNQVYAYIFMISQFFRQGWFCRYVGGITGSKAHMNPWYCKGITTSHIVIKVPRSVPRSGENPAVKKSQHKSPLIFFYAAPPFSGLALPT